MRYLLVILLALTACGRDEGGSSTPTPENGDPSPVNLPEPLIQSLALDTPEDLGECAEANNRQLVYVMSTQQFFTCQAGTWTEIDVRGPQGEPGKDAEIPAEPEVDWQVVYNALVTVKEGQTWDTMLPEAKKMLLEMGKADDTGTYVISSDYYDGDDTDGCRWEFYAQVWLDMAGKVIIEPTVCYAKAPAQ